MTGAVRKHRPRRRKQPGVTIEMEDKAGLLQTHEDAKSGMAVQNTADVGA